jgi:hypothetical protein
VEIFSKVKKLVVTAALPQSSGSGRKAIAPEPEINSTNQRNTQRKNTQMASEIAK